MNKERVPTLVGSKFLKGPQYLDPNKSEIVLTRTTDNNHYETNILKSNIDFISKLYFYSGISLKYLPLSLEYLHCQIL